MPHVDRSALELPETSPPPEDYRHFSLLSQSGLEDCRVRVVWDSGAEGATISARAASRLLRQQALLPLEERRGLVDLGRLGTAQDFDGFQESRVLGESGAAPV